VHTSFYTDSDNQETPRKINCDLIVLTADSHGEWQSLFKKIDHLQLENCLLIHCGDIGLGFNKGCERDIIKYNNWFKERNIEFLGVQGNHENPAYFNGSINFSHFKALKNYTILSINNEIWQFVGGAISVDRKMRVEGRDYWRDEVFVLDKERATKCDVLITHTGPPWIGPSEKGQHMEQYYAKDLHLREELIQERKSIQELYDICRPKKSFLGHFHRHENNTYHGEGYTCKAMILDILEFYEYKKEN
jgi:hypothetical protein